MLESPGNEAKLLALASRLDDTQANPTLVKDPEASGLGSGRPRDVVSLPRADLEVLRKSRRILDDLVHAYWEAVSVHREANGWLDDLDRLMEADDDARASGFVKLSQSVSMMSLGDPHQEVVADRFSAFADALSSTTELVDRASELRFITNKSDRTERLQQALTEVISGVTKLVKTILQLQTSCRDTVKEQLEAMRSRLDNIEGRIAEADETQSRENRSSEWPPNGLDGGPSSGAENRSADSGKDGAGLSGAVNRSRS